MIALERAARALHRARIARQHPKPDNYPWEDLSRRDQGLLRADAWAVINAIREPSDEMKRVGSAVTRGAGDERYWADGVGAYEAMIDALLKEGR